MNESTREWMRAMAALFEAAADEESAQDEADQAINALVQIDLRPGMEFVTADQELNDVSVSTVQFGASLAALISDLEAIVAKQIPTCFLK